jgi:hypothetical protein
MRLQQVRIARSAGYAATLGYIRMSRFAKNFHLTCAIIASFTCIVWLAIFGLVFYWHAISPRLDPATIVFALVPALFVGAGALMEFSFYNDERTGKASHEDGSLVTSDEGKSGVALITTVPRALAAIVFKLLMLVQGLLSLLSMRPYSLIWLFAGLFPHWAVVLATVAFYVFLAWTAMNFARAPSNKEEKAVLLMIFAVLLLAPIGVLLPKATLPLRFLETLFELVALLASISLLLSLHKDHEEPRHEDRS